jgi:succinate dehydrogenase/fumarate reductase flavoprotein subunit
LSAYLARTIAPMNDPTTVDVLVVGTGASGLAAAVTAAKSGLKVLIVEKEAKFGGTTVTSGGVLWIPGNRHSVAMQKVLGVTDSLAQARRYLEAELGDFIERDRVEAFLKYGPEMVDFMEKETHVRFYGMDYPDYSSESPGSSNVRSIGTVDFQARELGPRIRELKNILPQILFLGLAIGSGVEMVQFMRAGRSPKAFAWVVAKMIRHFLQLLRYGQSQQVVRGRALVARLAKTLFDLGVPLWLKSPVRRLLVENGTVCGAEIHRPEGSVHVRARRGVVLACGGYPNDPQRRAATFPSSVAIAEHRTPAPDGNTGDGIRMAEAAGGVFNANVRNAGAWAPISVIPGVSGANGVWPHLVDRQKPGFIMVLNNGRRFGDESSSYHDLVPVMVKACAAAGYTEASAWLIADCSAMRRWGIGVVRPFPVPYGRHLRSGYLLRAPSIAALAVKAGIDSVTLEGTVREFNDGARAGLDPAFGRGSRVYDLYQGDEEHQPNPCLGALEKAPFFTIKIYASEIGTFAGLRTDADARVVDTHGTPVPGLYAVGNDQASVFAGAYPGAGATLGPGVTFGYIAGQHLAGMGRTDSSGRAPPRATGN